MHSKRTVTSVMAVLILSIFAITFMVGCGGGGGGGGAATPAPAVAGSVTPRFTVGKTATEAAATNAAKSISVPSDSTVYVRYEYTNTTSADITNLKASVTPRPGSEVVEGSTRVQYLSGATKKDIPLGDIIKDGIELKGEDNANIILPANGGKISVTFQMKVASFSDVSLDIVGGITSTDVALPNGSVTITVMTGSSATTATLKVTSNEDDTDFSLVDSDGETKSGTVANAGDTVNVTIPSGAFSSFACEAKNGKTVAMSVTSGTVAAGGSKSLSCTYTATSTSTTGRVVFTSTDITTVSITASGQTYTGNITSNGGSVTATLPVGSYTNAGCLAIAGKTLTISKTSGTVTAGGTDNVTCTYTATETSPGNGTVTVTSNLNVANTTVTCNGVSYSHYRLAGREAPRELHMDSIGGGQYGYTITMPAGSCTITNTAMSGYALTASSVTTGTLAGGGNLPLTLIYTTSDGGAIGPGDVTP